MVATLGQFIDVLTRMGSDVTFHREDAGEPCPCRTFEGFRDPQWHRDHATDDPVPPMCNEQGFLANVTEFVVKASVQQFRKRGNIPSQYADPLLGDVRTDDKLGIFPVEWNGHVLDFYDWSEAGEDYILYDGRRYIVVSADKVPDVDGDPNHHWEVSLRLAKNERPTDG